MTGKVNVLGEASGKNRLNFWLLNDWPHLTITAFLTSVGWSILVALGYRGWPGLHECVEDYLEISYCFCERPRKDAIIMQPANTYSNLSFALVALFCAWAADTRRFPRGWWENTNLITGNKYFSLTYCALATNISYCSGFFHASFTNWGNDLDVISIILILVWLVSHSLARLYLWRDNWNTSLIAVATKFHVSTIAVVAFIFFVGNFTFGIPKLLFSITMYSLFPILAICEAYLHFSHMCRKGMEEMMFSNIWVAATLSVIAGFVAQQLSQSGRFCDPDGWFQGHGLWHVLAALSVLFFFFFLVSDDFVSNTETSASVSVTDDKATSAPTEKIEVTVHSTFHDHDA